MSRLARLVFDTRRGRQAIPDAFPNYARDPFALATDLRFKRWARIAGFFGAGLDLLAALCGTDKFGLHDYTPVYEALARPLRRQPVTLLELGVGGYGHGLGGESLLMWAAYFRRGRIYGIDLEDKTALSHGRIKVVQCSQTDTARLEALAGEIGPFDFVIDDGSHVNAHQIESFRILWPFVKDGGWYVVEDVQTSYWPSYGGATPGSPRHGASCMGFFKSLADSVNECEFLERPGVETVPSIGHIAFHHNMIVLRKDESRRTSNVPLGNEKVRATLMKPRSDTVKIRALAVQVTPSTTWVFARVTGDDGTTGWGEGTLQGRAAEVSAAIEAFDGKLGPIPADLVKAAAYSAVEQALWDLKARRTGRPLAELLGGAKRARVPLYANINRGTTDRSPAGFAARVAEAAALGFDAIKIAPFDNRKEAYARIAAAADAIAGRAELQVDCHWRFDEAAALEALAECARLGVTWFECPLPETPENYAAIKRLRAKANAAGMRLAGAEQFIGAAGFQPLLEQGLYDVVMPDIKYAGGLAECLRIAELAARHGCAVSLHNPSGPVCHAHSVHLSAVLEGAERLEYQHGETPLFFAIAPGLEAPADGSAALPTPFDIRGVS